MHRIEVGVIKQSVNQSAKYLEARNQLKPISVKDRSTSNKNSIIITVKVVTRVRKIPPGGRGGDSAYERGGDARRLA